MGLWNLRVPLIDVKRIWLLKCYRVLSALVCSVFLSVVISRKVKTVSLTRMLRSHLNCQILFALSWFHSVLHFSHNESSSFLPALLLFRLSSSIEFDAAAVEDNYGGDQDGNHLDV